MSAGDVFLGLLAIIFPPIAVWIKSGICSADSLINILLCMLGYVPGLIHAWYIISIYPEHEYDYEPINNAERGASTQYYVIGDGRSGSRQAQGRSQGQQGGQRQQNYGGTSQGDGQRVPNDTRPAAQFPGAASGAKNQNPQEQGSGEAGGSNGAARPPPTYDEAVQGDHKIQTQ